MHVPPWPIDSMASTFLAFPKHFAMPTFCLLEMILAPQQINLFTFTPAFTLPGAGFLHNAAPLDSVGWRGDFPWTL